jgi:iron complex outermembrane receptor protein
MRKSYRFAVPEVCLLLGLLFLKAGSLLSQPSDENTTGAIAGVVRDAESGVLLPLANISVLNSISGTSTDMEGRFNMENLLEGKYTLSVTYIGYETLTETVKVQAGKSTWINLSLKPLSQVVGEVVVTASLRSQAIRLAPASIGVITSAQLKEKNITNFTHAFDDMPGVVVTRTGNSNVQAFSIRGASEVAGGGIGNRVLLLIDGRPALSPESGGALWNLVPLSSIERVEVVRGAYSSLYGSSAMGGVVNIITRKPSLEPEIRLHASYGAYNAAPKSTGYKRYNDFSIIDFAYSRHIGKVAFLLDGSKRSDDGYKEKSGFDLYNFFGKTLYDFNSNHHLVISGNLNWIKNDFPATWYSTRQAYSVAPYRKDDFQDRREVNADIYYYATPSTKLKYSSRLYRYSSNLKYIFDTDPGNDSTNINIGKQIIQESNVRSRRWGNVSQVEFFPNATHYLIAGTDIKKDYVLGIPDTILYGEHQSFSAGIYLQDEISIGNRFTATIGCRYDYFSIVNQVEESNFSPKISMLYKVDPKFSIRMLLAQAFRDPPIAERFIKFEQGGGLTFFPNPNLKPEKLSVSAELGAKFEPFKGGTFDVALFYNRYKNLIAFYQISNPLEPLSYKVVNLKQALLQGAEFSYRQKLNDVLSLSLSYTYLDARDISKERLNDYLAYKVKHTLGFSTTANKGKFMWNLNGRFRSRIYEVSLYPGNEPESVFVANTKFSYRPFERLSCYFAASNLTNAQYEEMERYRMPGRSYAIGIECKFE